VAQRPAVVAVRTKAKAGKDDKADKEMEVYKAERCRPLMTWWEASLDEVSPSLWFDLESS
jgi:hypothetical protein